MIIWHFHPTWDYNLISPNNILNIKVTRFKLLIVRQILNVSTLGNE